MTASNKPLRPEASAPLPSEGVAATVAARLGLRRAALAALGVSLATNVLLGVHVAFCRPVVTTVLLPPGGGAWSVTDDRADRDYLERMALDLAQRLGSLTPSTAKKRLLSILDYAAPETHADLSAQLQREAARLAKEHASTVFFPERVTVDVERQAVSVTGLSKTLIGSDVTSSAPAVWHFLFRVSAGRLELLRLAREDGERAAVDTSLGRDKLLQKRDAS